jgi:alpha-L-fucosidase
LDGTVGDVTDGAWFDEARFGMFVHWGHGSQHGWELSWPLVGGASVLPACAPVPTDEYHAAAATFCPRPGAAAEWASSAVDAGMGYGVLTARHHDGFALWPTRCSDHSIAMTPYVGDLVGEFVDAFRAAGLHVGLYYSLPDWHHPDYPAFRSGDSYQFIAYPRPDPEAWERYLEYLRGQLTELLTDYGTIDLLWFDGGWERTAEEWRSAELGTLLRELQPDILVNDRMPGFGDYDTPEQFVPPIPPARRWETCLTMNRSWGWVPTDTEWKRARELTHTLIETAAKGGNLLLNVSPMADGALPAVERERLATIGAWMARHPGAIVGTEPGLEPWQFYGPSTRHGDRLYLFLLARPYDSVSVRGIPIRRVRSVRHLASGTSLEHRSRCTVLDELLNPDPMGELVIDVPQSLVDDVCTVVELEIS